MQFKQELLRISQSLVDNHVDFLVIGGFAVSFHGYTRATNDIDIWLRPSNENFLNFIKAVEQLGFDGSELRETVFDPKKTFIRLPLHILNAEFLTDIPGGISFTEAMGESSTLELDGMKVKIIGFDHLIRNKQSTNRPKDQLDIIELKRRRSQQGS